MTVMNHANLVRANPALNRPAVLQLLWHRKRIVLLVVIAVAESYIAFTSTDQRKLTDFAEGLRTNKEKKDQQIRDQRSRQVALQADIHQLQAQEKAGAGDAQGLGTMAEEVAKARVAVL